MARPRLPFSLRPATAADEEALYLLKRDALRPCIEATWGWNEEDQRERHRRAFPKEGVRILERDGELLGAFRAFERDDRILVAWILVRPERQSRGIGTRLLRLVQKQADASHFPVELHVLRVNVRALALYRRLGFAVVETGDTHHILRWEGRRTARRGRRRPAITREMTLGPHEWLLLGGSVLAGQQMPPLGVETGIGLSVAVFVALTLKGLHKRARHGPLLLRIGWLTRTTAIILGLAFVAATVSLIRADHFRAGRAAPFAAGVAILFLTYAPRTMEIRRRGMLLPYRRGWIPADAVRDYSWDGEAGDELVFDLTPDPQTGLPRLYRRRISRSLLGAVDAAVEGMLTPRPVEGRAGAP